MLNDKEFEKFVNGIGWVDYLGRLYECIGQAKDSRFILSDVNDGECRYVTGRALRFHQDFYYTEEY